ncbi:hypothetical protein KGS77_01180 [Streptomyces sp. MST-110588]|nr:hypothetical protein KGS77_01180 [Streptomyces sp. MST-110588]
MVPATCTVVDELPLTGNGKVDRKALAAAVRAPAAVRKKAYQAPRDETEVRLAELWAQALGVDVGGVGVHEDFFALGGRSLLAMRLMLRVERELGCRLPVSLLLRGATVAELAAAVREQRRPKSERSQADRSETERLRAGTDRPEADRPAEDQVKGEAP